MLRKIISPRRAAASLFSPQPAVLLGATALGLALGFGCSSPAGPLADEDGSGGSSPGGGLAGSTATPAGSSGAGGAASGGAGQGGGITAGGASGGGAASSGGAGAGTGGSSAGQGGSGGAGGGTADVKSKGCGQMRTLKDGKNMLTTNGMQRTYALRVPANYDNTHPYRLILGFHGATSSSESVELSNAPDQSYFGLLKLSEGSTIFAAPDASTPDRIWKPDRDGVNDVKMVEDLLTQLKNDLCIDTSRIVAEGFSHGGAMTWTLACALPGTFQAAVVHSGGGLPIPKTCQPIPFISALGNDGSGQDMSSDFFAMTNGCTVESLPLPPKGGHVCTDYKGCSAGHPTRYCDYDGPHTPSHIDPGQSQSWVPQEVWKFLTQF
jgi:hypothetical protein